MNVSQEDVKVAKTLSPTKNKELKEKDTSSKVTSIQQDEKNMTTASGFIEKKIQSYKTKQQ